MHHETRVHRARTGSERPRCVVRPVHHARLWVTRCEDPAEFPRDRVRCHRDDDLSGRRLHRDADISGGHILDGREADARGLPLRIPDHALHHVDQYLVLNRSPSKCLADGVLERLDRSGKRPKHASRKYGTESRVRDGALTCARCRVEPIRSVREARARASRGARRQPRPYPSPRPGSGPSRDGPRRRRAPGSLVT